MGVPFGAVGMYVGSQVGSSGVVYNSPVCLEHLVPTVDIYSMQALCMKYECDCVSLPVVFTILHSLA